MRKRAWQASRGFLGTLFEAIEELEKDEFIRNSLGNHVANKYIEAKRKNGTSIAPR